MIPNYNIQPKKHYIFLRKDADGHYDYHCKVEILEINIENNEYYNRREKEYTFRVISNYRDPMPDLIILKEYEVHLYIIDPINYITNIDDLYDFDKI